VRYARLVYWNPGYRCVFINTLSSREPPFHWEKWVRMFPMYDTATEAAVAWVGQGVLPEGAVPFTES
jgi:hypothetical protein